VRIGAGGGWLSYQKLVTGAKVMERYIPAESRPELSALAQAADVDYMDLVAAQLFVM